MSSPSTTTVFLSYRREDTAFAAGRLGDRLNARFGRVFMDVDNIDPGVDFTVAIRQAVDACDILVALIGERWTSVVDPHGHRRLDDPDDWVVQEIRVALERGIRVIPVLVDAAKMPSRHELPEDLGPLTSRNAANLRHASFDADSARLLDAIERALATTPRAPSHSSQRRGAAADAVRDPGGSARSASSGRRPSVMNAELVDTHNQFRTSWTVRLDLGSKSYSIRFDHDDNTKLLVFVDDRLVVKRRIMMQIARSITVFLDLSDGVELVKVRTTTEVTWALGRIKTVEFAADGLQATVQDT